MFTCLGQNLKNFIKTYPHTPTNEFEKAWTLALVFLIPSSDAKKNDFYDDSEIGSDYRSDQYGGIFFFVRNMSVKQIMIYLVKICGRKCRFSLRWGHSLRAMDFTKIAFHHISVYFWFPMRVGFDLLGLFRFFITGSKNRSDLRISQILPSFGFSIPNLTLL